MLHPESTTQILIGCSSNVYISIHKRLMELYIVKSELYHVTQRNTHTQKTKGSEGNGKI